MTLSAEHHTTAAQPWARYGSVFGRLVRGWLWLLVAGVVIGLAGAAIGLLATGASYRAEAIMLFDQPVGTASPANGNETVQKLAALMNSYAVLATSDSVLQSASASAGVPGSLSHLRSKVHASQVPASLAVSITAEDDKAGRATALAQSVAQSLRTQVLSIQQQGGVPTAFRFTVNEIEQPIAKKTNNHAVRTLLAAGIFGLLAAIVIAYLIERSRLPD